MEVTSATNTTTTSSTTESTTSAATLTSVDFDNFLTLLTTQLSNQDPLNPLDSADFVAQLASFSSVEQLVGTNERLDNIAEALNGNSSSTISEYANWIGREAEVMETAGYFDGSTPMEYRLSGNVDASNVTVTVTDAGGNAVASFAASNGNSLQSWNGDIGGATAPAGSYTVSAVYTDSAGEDLGSEVASTIGTVEEVRLIDGSAILAVTGGIAVDPSKVTALGA